MSEIRTEHEFDSLDKFELMRKGLTMYRLRDVIIDPVIDEEFMKDFTEVNQTISSNRSMELTSKSASLVAKQSMIGMNETILVPNIENIFEKGLRSKGESDNRNSSPAKSLSKSYKRDRAELCKDREIVDSNVEQRPKKLRESNGNNLSSLKSEDSCVGKQYKNSCSNTENRLTKSDERQDEGRCESDKDREPRIPLRELIAQIERIGETTGITIIIVME